MVEQKAMVCSVVVHSFSSLSIKKKIDWENFCRKLNKTKPVSSVYPKRK